MRRGDLNLYVTDLDASERFYSDALGFKLDQSDDVSRTLRSGDVAITLFMAKAGPAPTRGSTPMMTADLLVTDLDAALASFEAAGGRVESVADWELGRFAVVADPDGIGWELIEGAG
ncbi:MAG: VOC family protein [Acidimicrobiia bacterium]|nr:VOC family protein [Acidimicrobiia bacterium]